MFMFQWPRAKPSLYKTGVLVLSTSQTARRKHLVAWLMTWSGIYEIPTFRQRYPVPLAVQQTPQLLEVALPLDVVLDGRGLHEEGVEAVLLPDAVDARAVAAGVHARLGGLHKCIDLLIGGDGGALPQIRVEHCHHSKIRLVDAHFEK